MFLLHKNSVLRSSDKESAYCITPPLLEQHESGLQNFTLQLWVADHFIPTFMCIYNIIYIVFGQLVKQITLITLQKTLVKTQKYAIKSRRNVEIINLKYLSVQNCKNGVKEFNLC